jgi:hypothetical protein
MNAICSACNTTLTGKYCSNCGSPASGTANTWRPSDQESQHVASTGDVIKLLGAEQFLYVLKRTFVPIRHIRQAASSVPLRLTAFLISYVEFGTIINLFNEYILKGAIDNLNYPWSFEDRSKEMGILTIIIGTLLSALALAVTYFLPARLFHPVGKIKAMCLLFVVFMYFDLYYALTSATFIIYWLLAQDRDSLVIISFLRTVAIHLFALYAIRFGIGLSWLQAVILLCVSLLLAGVTAIVYFSTGIWELI